MNFYVGMGIAYTVVSILRIVVLCKTYQRITLATKLLAGIYKHLKGKT